MRDFSVIDDLKSYIEGHPDWARLESMIADSNEPLVRVKRGPVKYLNAGEWLRVCVDRWNVIKEYDERFACSDSSALDIGTGFGYFPFVGSRMFGVDTEATEAERVPWREIYRTATDILEVTVHPLSVMKFQPIDVGLKKYDLVTSYRIVFDTKNGTWGKPEWKFFLEEVKRSLLKPHGILVLAFNGKRQRNQFVTFRLCPVTVKPDLTVIVRGEDM